MSEEKEKSPAERFMLQLIGVKPEDVTLKFLFDNIRNYGIAATVMVAGYYLFQHGAQVNHFPGAGIVSGTLLITVGFILHALNFCQAILALVKLKMGVYLILSTAMFLSVSELLWVLIKMKFPMPGLG